MTVMSALESTLYAGVARTATPTTAALFTSGRRYLAVVINVSAVPGSAPSVVPTIDGYDIASAAWYNILTGVAITATGTTVLKVGSDIGQVANAAASDFLPSQVRVVMTHGNANSVTYTVGTHLAA